MIQALGFILSLLVIVALVVKKVNYGVALLVGALIIGVSSQLSPQEFIGVFIDSLENPTTLDLVLIVSLIPILASSMRETGMVDELVRGIERAVSGKAVLYSLPALMGALPILGGALLSAPLIDEEADRLGLTRDEKSFVNVWFRHWNFFLHPLSPSLILAAALTNISLYTLILVQLPSAVIYMLLGYLISIHRIRENCRGGRGLTGLRSLPSVFLNTSPIILAVILNIAGLHMAAALALGIIFTFLLKRIKFRGALSILWKGFDWRFPFAMVGVMYLRHMIGYSGAASSVMPYIEYTGMPMFLALTVMAWAIGFMTATPTASVAIIFPIALTALGDINPALTSILYLSMFFSYLTSPTHLCLVLTVEYYKSELHNVYRKLMPASMAVYLITLMVAAVMATFM